MKLSMSYSKRHATDRSVMDEAAAWLATLSDESCSVNERAEFARWLTRSNTHVEEFLRISTLTHRLQSAARWSDVDIDALVSQARTESTVIDLPGGLAPREESVGVALRARRASVPRRGLLSVAAAFILVVVLAFLVYRPPIWLSASHTYATGIGELRSVALEDGSVLELDAQSRVRTRFSPHERRIDLLDGEAEFKVVKDPKRPFTVLTSHANVTALGTQFDVSARSNRTVVTVIEGQVAVSSGMQSAARSEQDIAVPAKARQGKPAAVGSARARPGSSGRGLPGQDDVVLGAGEQAVVEQQQPIVRASLVDAKKVIGWTGRRLYFEDVPVSTAVREFSRYSPRVIRFDDPRLAERHITGVFDSSDPGSLVQFLERYGDVAVRKTEQGWTLGRAAAE